MATKPKFKDGEYVRVISGKFRGWDGQIASGDMEYDARTKKWYYGIYPNSKGSYRNGNYISARDVGFGFMYNIPENHIRKG